MRLSTAPHFNLRDLTTSSKLAFKTCHASLQANYPLRQKEAGDATLQEPGLRVEEGMNKTGKLKEPRFLSNQRF